MPQGLNSLSLVWHCQPFTCTHATTLPMQGQRQHQTSLWFRAMLSISPNLPYPVSIPHKLTNNRHLQHSLIVPNISEGTQVLVMEWSQSSCLQLLHRLTQHLTIAGTQQVAKVLALQGIYVNADTLGR